MAQRGVNKAIIVGNLGQDPEVRYAQSGTAFATLSVATSETWKDKQTGQQQERTEWHRISIIGKLAEIAGEYLRKGSKVYIEGKLQTRKWQADDGTDRYTTEIVVDGFGGVMQMLDSYGQGQGQQAPAQQQQKAQNKPYQRPVERYGSAAPNPMANEPAQQPRQQQMPDYDSFDDDIPF